MLEKCNKSVVIRCFGWWWNTPVVLCGMLLAGTWTLQLATLYGCWWLEGWYTGYRAVQWISISCSGTWLYRVSTVQRSKWQQSVVLCSGTLHGFTEVRHSCFGIVCWRTGWTGEADSVWPVMAMSGWEWDAGFLLHVIRMFAKRWQGGRLYLLKFLFLILCHSVFWNTQKF
jgi:hypothetical protein